jgi:hypothetical protein
MPPPSRLLKRSMVVYVEAPVTTGGWLRGVRGVDAVSGLIFGMLEIGRGLLEK